MSPWPETELLKKNFARPALARAVAGGSQPIRAGGGRSLYKETLEEALWVAEGGPGSGGCRLLSNPN